VSIAASFNRHPEIAVGNVMGSTVANVGLIVGVSGLVRPISVHRKLVVRETPLVILVLSIVMLLSLNDALGRLDGFILVGGFSLYMVFLLRWGSRGFNNSNGFNSGHGPADETPAPPTDESGDVDPIFVAAQAVAAEVPPLRGAILRILVGLPCLVVGARWLLGSAESIAIALSVPEAVVAATIIAVGTSLPELASTVVAALRGFGDIAIGAVIGSNVFNLGLVLGTAAIVRPLQLSPTIVVGQVLPALAFSVLLIPLALTHQRVDRWEAGLLLAGYAAFIFWVI
jgi:cation:H+ antiporter